MNRLDTSCILRWLLDEGFEVVAFLAAVGQEENWEAVEQKALKIGAQKMVIEDLSKEFIEELAFRAVQCNAIYEGRYLLGTSLARPVIARALMRCAQRENCQFVSHGATGVRPVSSAIIPFCNSYKVIMEQHTDLVTHAWSKRFLFLSCLS